MKKMFVLAMAVMTICTVIAQEKVKTVSVRTNSETSAVADKGAVVDAAANGMTEIEAGDSFRAAAEHGATVSTLAKSTALIGSTGDMVSDVAIAKALEVSPNADEINLGNSAVADLHGALELPRLATADGKTAVKTDVGIKMNPIPVSVNLKIKTGLGINLR